MHEVDKKSREDHLFHLDWSRNVVVALNINHKPVGHAQEYTFWWRTHVSYGLIYRWFTI